MRWFIRSLKWGAAILLLAFFHYILPQHDVVRITSSAVIRTEISSWNSLFFAQADNGNTTLASRDVRFINATKRSTWLFGFVPRDREKVMVYRNEDTGWIWPPYFKFDSADLQAEADGAVSAPTAEQWAVITHYGWRNRFISIYPNAISIKPVAGPDVRVIPWFNIVFFTAMLAGFFFLRAVWRQFRERMIDPAIDKVEDRWDEMEAGMSQRRSRLSRWWQGK